MADVRQQIPDELVTSAGALDVNHLQIGGTTVDTNSGNKSAGTQRMVIATDQPNLTTALNVSAVESGTWTVGANSATGSAVPANGFYDAYIAKTALPTAGSDGNLVGGMADKFGRQIVLPVTIRDLVGTQTTTISSTTETTVVTAGGAGVFNDVSMFIASNTSSTAVRVDFRDTTAGSILFSLFVPASDMRGFSMGGVPVPQTTANTNWTAQLSSAVTDVRIYAVFAKNK